MSGDLAITGMAARFGDLVNLAELERASFAGRSPAPTKAPVAADQLAGELAAAALADADLEAPAAVVVAGPPDAVRSLARIYPNVSEGSLGDVHEHTLPALVVNLDDAGGGAALVLANRADAQQERIYASLPDGEPAEYVELDNGWTTGLASLIRAALAAYYGYIPATAPAQSLPWFRPAGRRRVAAVNDGASRCFVAAESEPARVPRAYTPLAPRYLLQVASPNLAQALEGLAALRQQVAGGRDLRALAAQQDPAQGPRIALLARSAEDMLHEIEAARSGVPAAFEARGEWQTPHGSYFTTQPLGGLGTLAFVYPGAFSAYPGMARDVFRVFPGSFAALSNLTTDPGELLGEEVIYPRLSQALAGRLMGEYEARLMADPVAMVQSGTACAVLYTHILRDVIGLRPAAALGYSLGEMSMLWAFGVWTDPDAVDARLAASPLFRTRLAGPQETVLAYRAAAGYFEHEGDPWGTFTLLASASDVEEALQGYDLAFLTVINGPEEVVIGGDPGQCRAVAAHVGCECIRMPFSYPLHSPVTMIEVAEFARLNLHPTMPLADARLYSACHYQALEIESHALAEATARMSCKLLDFPRLIEKAYADGARIFIEVGPQSSCTRLIDAILSGRPHLATPVDRRGADVESSLFRMLARLVSHGVAFDGSAMLAPTP